MKIFSQLTNKQINQPTGWQNPRLIVAVFFVPLLLAGFDLRHSGVNFVRILLEVGYFELA